MTLTNFIAFFLGILLEGLLLWEAAPEAVPEKSPSTEETGLVAAPFLSRERLLMIGLTVGAAVLIGLFTLIGWDKTPVYIDTPGISLIFVLLGLGLLYYGIVSPHLLPRINEEAALSIHITVALSLLLTRPAGGPWWPYALGLGAPWALLLVATLPQQAPPPLAKAGIYLWYLITLLALTLQTDFSAINEPASTPLALGEAFVLGAGGLFLLLHGLFLVRFALMTSSLINPAGRALMRRAIPKLYSDEQLPLVRVLLLQALAVAVLILNARFNFIPDLSAVTLLVMAFAQGLPAISQESGVTSQMSSE